MNIISPEFSFLNFNYNEYSDACDAEQLNALPVCNDLSIKAQIEVETSEDLLVSENPIYIGIADSDCNIIYEEDIEVQPICSKYKFLTTFEEFVISEENQYNLCNTDFDEPTNTQDFTVNPFDEITSNDITFQITFPKEEQLQLYIEDKVYIIWLDYFGFYPYSYTQQDNVYFVRVSSGGIGDDSVTRNRFLAFLNEVIDVNHSTTSSLSSPTFTIADVPAGSYINNSFDFVNTLTGVTASTNIGKLFYWNNGQIIYYTTELADTSYSFQADLEYVVAYRFKIYYTSFYNDITGTITFDDGTNTPTVVNISFDSYDGFIDVSYIGTFTSTHTITIDFTDLNGHLNGLNIQKIEQYDTVFFNVTQNISGNVPIGLYSKTELINLISDILGFDFDCEFTSCCDIADIEFNVTLNDEDTDYLYKLSPYWQKGFVDFPELDLDTINTDCFTYAILDKDKNLIACSNLFEKVTDCCYVSKIEYSNNEDAFGFTYPTGVTNSINFPFFLHSPKYPTTEKIYKQTNGQYKRLSADIEKEYNCETDYIQESYHDKLITALKHDTVIVTSNRLGFTTQMSQQGDYSPDWNSKIDFTSKAEFKLRKYFNGKNNNCGTNC